MRSIYPKKIAALGLRVKFARSPGHPQVYGITHKKNWFEASTLEQRQHGNVVVMQLHETALAGHVMQRHIRAGETATSNDFFESELTHFGPIMSSMKAKAGIKEGVRPCSVLVFRRPVSSFAGKFGTTVRLHSNTNQIAVRNRRNQATRY